MLYYTMDELNNLGIILQAFGHNEFTVKEFAEVLGRTQAVARHRLRELELSYLINKRAENFNFTDMFGNAIASVRYHYSVGSSDYVLKRIEQKRELELKYALKKIDDTIRSVSIDLQLLHKKRELQCNFLENGGYILNQVFVLMHKNGINELDKKGIWALYNAGKCSEEHVKSVYNKIKTKGNDFVLKLTKDNLINCREAMQDQLQRLEENRVSQTEYIVKCFDQVMQNIEQYL